MTQMLAPLYKSTRRLASAFVASRHGNTTLIFAGVASALFGAIGVAVDYAYLLNQETRLQ